MAPWLTTIAQVVQELVRSLRSLRGREVPWTGTLLVHAASVATEATSATLWVHRWLLLVVAVSEIALPLLEAWHVAVALADLVGVAPTALVIIAVLMLHA